MSKQFWQMIHDRREAIQCLHHDGMGEKQIARELGVSLLSVRSVLRVLGLLTPVEKVAGGTPAETEQRGEMAEEAGSKMTVAIANRWVMPVERQPGEAHYTCLWCSQWRCHQPLKKCEECQAKYEAAYAALPEYLR